MTMDKNEMIEDLKRSILWEDGFLQKYNNETVQDLIDTLPKAKAQKIKKLLNENIKDTEWHAKTIKEIVKNLEEGKYDS